MCIKRILLASLIVVTSACTDDTVTNPLIVGDDCLRGTGDVITENRDLGDFTDIQNAIPANVFIEQGPLEAVRIEAPSNILEEINTTVDNNLLNIRINKCIENLEGVNIFVTIPQINRLVQAGVGNMTTVNEINVNELDVILTGVGNFNLQGFANDVIIALDGVGDIEAFSLNTDICEIDITGVGNVEVSVNDELDVTITGAGFVYYKGNPTVTSTITGDGSVVDAN